MAQGPLPWDLDEPEVSFPSDSQWPEAEHFQQLLREGNSPESTFTPHRLPDTVSQDFQESRTWNAVWRGRRAGHTPPSLNHTSPLLRLREPGVLPRWV